MTTSVQKAKIIADARAELEAEIRAELMAEAAELREQMRAEILADVAVAAIETAIEAEPEPQPEPGAFVPVRFWSITPVHSLRLKRPGGNGFIKFVNGTYLAETEGEAEAIRTHLRGQAFEEDMPAAMQPKRDEITGYAPRAFMALEAYREYITPIYPAGWAPPSN